MKILHLTSQQAGGAGKACFRLHQALLKYGIKSFVITQSKISDTSNAESIEQMGLRGIYTYARIAWSKMPNLLYKHREKDIFSSSIFFRNKRLIQKIQEINPDIIHLHWINLGFMHPNDLIHINKPIIWSLHDANPYTGGCHITGTCQKFQTCCYACPHLSSKYKYDISYLTFKQKYHVYQKIDFTVNGISSWIASEAKKSRLFQKKAIINLPNLIDSSVFFPMGKRRAQQILKLNSNKIILCFGAIKATEIPRKGYLELQQALELLPNKSRYEILVFGSNGSQDIAGIRTHFLGHLNDDLSLLLVYNAAHIFITPSLAENLSNVIMESLSCGTPVVAFDIGGNSDLITHFYNGYLAKNVEDMKNGILWVEKHLQITSMRSREVVEKKFSYNTIVPKYIDAYTELMRDKTNEHQM